MMPTASISPTANGMSGRSFAVPLIGAWPELMPNWRTGTKRLRLSSAVSEQPIVRLITTENIMDAAHLRSQANSCRRLANVFANQTTVEMLNRMAAEFDRVACNREAGSSSERVLLGRSGR